MKSTRPGATPAASASPRRSVASGSGSLSSSIKRWGKELGFQAVGIADADLSAAEPRLLEWLGRGWHGEMEYMARHGALRARPGELKPGTLRVISCRMNYLNDAPQGMQDDPEKAVIARYARGRDYHKVLRDRLQKLCDRIAGEVGEFGYPFLPSWRRCWGSAPPPAAGLDWPASNHLSSSPKAAPGSSSVRFIAILHSRSILLKKTTAEPASAASRSA